MFRDEKWFIRSRATTVIKPFRHSFFSELVRKLSSLSEAFKSVRSPFFFSNFPSASLRSAVSPKSDPSISLISGNYRWLL